MSARKKIAYFIIGLAVLGGVFFRARIEIFFLSSKEKLADFTSGNLDQGIANLETVVSNPPPLRSEKNSSNPELSQAGTIKWTNVNRSENGLPALLENKKLDEAAMAKAKDIFAKQYFDHVSPTGRRPQDLVTDAGYEYILTGENLALGNFASDQALLEGWMASPGHRENILRKGYQEIGVAVLSGKYEGESNWVAVQEFGTPLMDCPAVDPQQKQLIEASNAKLTSLASTLQSEKDRVSKLDSSDPSASKKIDDFNSSVKQYNALVSKNKKLIDVYNQQVADFNSCAKKFQL
jgi:uncharacterized protein YkwD